MLRKIRKLIVHPNRYFYDYFRKKLGFRKFFVTDKIRQLDTANHQKWFKVLFYHPYLYLYYKFNKKLRNPAYPILVDYRIENNNKSFMGGGKQQVLAVELENQNTIYFTDSAIVEKVLEDKEPYLAGKIFKFKLEGRKNKIVLGSKISFDKSCKFIIRGSENVVQLGSGSIFSSGVTITFEKDRNHLFAGTNSRFRTNAKINFKSNNGLAYFGNDSSISSCNISIYMNSMFFYGSGCSANSGLTCKIYFDSNILIGSDCMLSCNIYMRTNDAHGLYDAESKKLLNTTKNIIIGAHVWIGQDVFISKGTKINNGCVLGARSLVTITNTPEKSVVAGVPAKIIKDNIIWDRRFPSVERKCPEINKYEIGLDRLSKINDIGLNNDAIDKVKIIQHILNS